MAHRRPIITEKSRDKLKLTIKKKKTSVIPLKLPSFWSTLIKDNLSEDKMLKK